MIYLHGFASGNRSTKGVAVERALGNHGVTVEQPDLNLPSFENLSPYLQLKFLQGLLTQDPRPTVLIGSSMGGWLATMLAPRRADETNVVPGFAQVKALLLLAPAFELGTRWRQRLDDATWERWQREGSMLHMNLVAKKQLPLHAEFLVEAQTLPQWPGTTIPTVVIQGRRDDVVPHSTARAWVDQNPHAMLLEVDDDHQLLATIPRIEDEAWRLVQSQSE